MTNRSLFLILFSGSLLMLNSCKKEHQRNPPDPFDPTPAPTALPTPVGQPLGNAVTATMGTSGGTLTLRYQEPGLQRAVSYDLTLPAGALDRTATISLQPIENKCPNGKGPALRITASDPAVRLLKPAELTVTETASANASEPEPYISVQDPVIRIWRGAKGRQIAPGKRRYKVHRLADWAQFQDYQLLITDYGKFPVTEDPVNGDVLQLIASQPVRMEVFRVRLVDAIPFADDSTLFIPVPLAEKVEKDDINGVKWRFNGVVVSEPSGLPSQSPQGFFVFEGIKFETLCYTAPLVLQGDGSTPLDVRIEAEVRERNNGPVMIMIKRFRVTNPNEFKLNGSQVKNAFATAEGNTGLFTMAFKRNTDPANEENIAFISMAGVGTNTYLLDRGSQGINVLSATTLGPKTTYDHSYVDRLGVEHFSGGRLTVSDIKTFTGYRIVSGNYNSTLYHYNQQQDQLRTITVSGNFRTVVLN